MAVYTPLTLDDFEEIAQAFALGRVQSFELIPQGSINTNARLQTEQGKFFVRHTTVRSAEELDFEADLLGHLAQARFPGPHMLTAGEARFVELAGGRACVFGYLVGDELRRAELAPEHLEALGIELGALHVATQSFLRERPNPYSPQVVGRWLAALSQHPSPEMVQVAGELTRALERAQKDESALLPRGVIHADLFMDNVKWLGNKVSAIFDFEMACQEAYVLDVAITLNAWCFDGGYRPELCRALMRGYQQRRPLSQVERQQLFSKMLFGAVRFTTSRIRDFHLSKLPPDKLAPKDFRTYLARVRQLELGGSSAVDGWMGW